MGMPPFTAGCVRPTVQSYFGQAPHDGGPKNPLL
jgi:hypothetical protein